METDINRFPKVMRSVMKKIKLGDLIKVKAGLATSVMVARKASLRSNFFS